MKEDLEFSQIRKEGICKLIAKGRIDGNTADSLLSELEKALTEGHKSIILNMAHVEYLSSIGIRVILKIYKQMAEEGGAFNIEHPSATVKNVLGMVALNEMLVSQ